jgi:dTDP-4-amino-4,6-dideoxygalactose transaminase
LPGITLPFADEAGQHVYHQYTILTSQRDAVMAALQAAGIGCAVYYPIPLHRQRAFAKDYCNVSLPVAEAVAQQCLSLPIFPEMQEAQVDEVVGVIAGVLSKKTDSAASEYAGQPQRQRQTGAKP